MKKTNTAAGFAIWVIGLALVHIILFYLTDEYTKAIWITYFTSLVIYGFHLVIWLLSFPKINNGEDSALFLPQFLFSAGHLVLQLVLCVVFLLLPNAPEKVTVLSNAGLFLAVLLLLLISAISKNHTQAIEQRQKNHHTEL